MVIHLAIYLTQNDTIQLDPTTRHKFSEYFCETIMDGDYDNDFCPGFKYCLDSSVDGEGDCGQNYRFNIRRW